jgi:hypothetical protein
MMRLAQMDQLLAQVHQPVMAGSEVLVQVLGSVWTSTVLTML